MIKKENLVDNQVYQWAVGFRPPYWDDDTIYYLDGEMDLLWPAVEKAQPHANRQGATLLYKEDWDRLIGLLQGDATVANLLAEVEAWGVAAFEKDDCVTIYGY